MLEAPRTDFTDVDKAKNPEGYVQCMEFQHGTAFVQMYKQRARLLLDIQPGQQILDAGCGGGQDSLEIARLAGQDSQIIGLDLSQTMLDSAQLQVQATHLPIIFRQGDLQQLPFANNTFDRCYADKTFQHLPDPRHALTELIRVTKPGGRLVIVDPDHDTHVLDTPYPELTHRFFRFRASGIRQPDIAHRMYALFQEFGLTNTVVEPLTWVTTDYKTIQPLSRFIEGMRLAQEHQIVTAEEADHWIAYLEAAIQSGRFFHAVTYFITTGCKPI